MPDSSRARLAAFGRPFRLLLVSDTLMVLSMMIHHVTVAWWIAEQGGAWHLSVYAGVLAAAAFVALPLLSPLGDRSSKRNLIAGGLGVMLLQGLGLALMAGAGVYRLDAVLVLEVVGIVAMSAIMPASLSIVAEILPAERLTEGLGWQKSAQAIGRLAGPVIGGVVLAVAGVAAAMWLLVAFLALATVLAARIVVPSRTGERAPVRWLADLRAGLVAKWKMPLERGWTSVSFCVMLFFGPAVGILIPLKVQSLGLSAAWLGACEAGVAAGILVGGLGGSVWLTRRVGRFRASVGCVFIEGLCMVAAGLAQSGPLLVVAFVFIGAAMTTVQMVGHTHRLLAMPPDFRARMTAVNIMVFQLAAIIGPALAGLGLSLWAIGPVYVAFGVCQCLLAFAYQQVPGYRTFLTMDHDQVLGHYVRTHPELFVADYHRARIDAP